ncbi:Protoporphyrinogen oxidase, chloroplastic/mitochondrial [Capsicum chinense]|nr:Protoporphyrinogen oxidase, chloroplastic/mitochondrial [Capsicum chinense]
MSQRSDLHWGSLLQQMECRLKAPWTQVEGRLDAGGLLLTALTCIASVAAGWTHLKGRSYDENELNKPERKEKWIKGARIRDRADQTAFSDHDRFVNQASRSKLKDIITSDLKQLLGAEGEPTYVSHVYWSKAFPLYGHNYDSVLEAIDKMEKNLPGLLYAGQSTQKTIEYKFPVAKFVTPILPDVDC